MLPFASQQPVENRAHGGSVRSKSVRERLDTRITEGPSDWKPGFGPGRKSVNLLFILNLQTMFDSPQKNIGLPERSNIFDGQNLHLLKSLECFESVSLLQEGVFRSVKQLQSLEGKLDFPYAAIPKFDVQMQILGSDNITFNSRF